MSRNDKQVVLMADGTDERGVVAVIRTDDTGHEAVEIAEYGESEGDVNFVPLSVEQMDELARSWLQRRIGADDDTRNREA